MPSDLIDSSPSPLYKPLQWTPCSSLNMLGMPQTWSLFNFLSGMLFSWISHFLTSFIFLLKYHFLTEALPDNPSCISLHCIPTSSPALFWSFVKIITSWIAICIYFILLSLSLWIAMLLSKGQNVFFFPLLWPIWYNGTWH